MAKLRAAVVGSTGYAGAELVRILSGHPNVDLTVITSRQQAGVEFDAIYPALKGFVRLACADSDPAVVTAGSHHNAIWLALRPRPSPY